MITARNYAAQAERGLMQFATDRMVMDSCRKDQEAAKVLAEIIKDAVHFVVPDDGNILCDDLRGLNEVRLSLPFAAITVEFWNSGSDEKIVVVATEEENDILVMAAHPVPGKSVWVPEQFATSIPRDIYCNAKYESMTAIPERIVCPGLYKLTGEDHETAHERIGTWWLCVAELLEALTCRNVTTEPIEVISPKVNARRVRNGKTPIYETRVLVVKTEETKKVGSAGGGTHNSPRQHLRRGHIRRLPKGNVWVNACVVGDASRGIVKKSYRVI